MHKRKRCADTFSKRPIKVEVVVLSGCLKGTRTDCIAILLHAQHDCWKLEIKAGYLRLNSEFLLVLVVLT